MSSGIITGGDANPKKVTAESISAWQLGGNTIGTDSNELGTLDDKDLEIIVRGNEVLKFTGNNLPPQVAAALLLSKYSFDNRGNFWFRNAQLDTIIQNIFEEPTIGLPNGRNTLALGNGFPDIVAINSNEILLPLLPNLSSLGTDADGKIIAGTGGGGTTLTQNQIAFGDASNEVTSSANLTFDGSTFNLSASATINIPNGEEYNVNYYGVNRLYIQNTKTRIGETNSFLEFNIDGAANSNLQVTEIENPANFYYENTQPHIKTFGFSSGGGTITLTDGILLVHKIIQIEGLDFASLPTGVNGMIARVTDSNTNTWGDVISGGGSNNVLAFFNGTDWTVFAK